MSHAFLFDNWFVAERCVNAVALAARDGVEAYEQVGSKPLTRAQQTEIEALADVPDSAIDTSDAPELLDWSGAKRGLFYKPVKQQLTLRIDADVVAWFKQHPTRGEGYQTRINRALREYVQGHISKAKRSRV